MAAVRKEMEEAIACTIAWSGRKTDGKKYFTVKARQNSVNLVPLFRKVNYPWFSHGCTIDIYRCTMYT